MCFSDEVKAELTASLGTARDVSTQHVLFQHIKSRFVTGQLRNVVQFVCEE
jgi:hypothetical protein